MKNPRRGISRENLSAADLKRFENLIKDGDDKCWIWLGKTQSGYPIFRFKGRSVSASKIAFCIFKDKTLDGRDSLIKTCLNKLCINPDHFKIRFARNDTCEKGHLYTEFGGISKGETYCKKCRQIDIATASRAVQDKLKTLTETDTCKNNHSRKYSKRDRAGHLRCSLCARKHTDKYKNSGTTLTKDASSWQKQALEYIGGL